MNPNDDSLKEGLGCAAMIVAAAVAFAIVQWVTAGFPGLAR